MFDGKQSKSFKFTDAESTNDTETKKPTKLRYITPLNVELILFMEIEKQKLMDDELHNHFILSKYQDEPMTVVLMTWTQLDQSKGRSFLLKNLQPMGNEGFW